jgi:ADP-heptose:LPS heptosyltransferase
MSLNRVTDSPPARILIIQPCCIGDVVMATAALGALRRAYPNARIAWLIGAWSRPALAGHPWIDALIDSGPGALPGILTAVRLIWAERPDLLVSFVRSPRISLAALLSGARTRVGPDSAGRGFGYTIRVPVDPAQRRHEAEIALDVVRALGIDTTGARTFVPVAEADAAAVDDRLRALGVTGDYLVVHAGGGRNPGMIMDAKRYPPDQLAELAARLARRLNAAVIVIGAADDADAVAAVTTGCRARGVPALACAGMFPFGQIGALAQRAQLYLGSDTGLTHYAAAAGARTVALFGPSDPARYAPYSDRALALWQPTPRVGSRGVSGGPIADWDWAREGIGVDQAEAQIIAWLERENRLK